jgi:hypothetical protein
MAARLLVMDRVLISESAMREHDSKKEPLAYP